MFQKTVAVYAGAMLIGMVLVSVPSSSIYLKQHLALTDAQYGSLFIAQLVFALLGALLAAPVVKRMPLKGMYLIALLCLLLSSLCLLAGGLVSDQGRGIIAVGLALALFGFGFGFGGGPLNGLAVVLYPHKTESALTSLHMMAGVGLMFGPLYFSWFETNHIWSIGPSVLIVVAAALLLLAFLALESDIPQIPDESRGELSPAATCYFWLIVLVAFVYALIEGMFSNWAPLFMTQGRGFSAESGALALSAFWGGLTLGRLLATFAVAKVDPFALWAALPFIMIATLLLIPGATGSTQAILLFGLAGLGCSAFFPLMIAVSSSPFPSSVSWIVSVLTASLMCGIGVGSYVIGRYVGDIGLDAIYYYAIVFPVALLALIGLSRFLFRKLPVT